MKLLALLAVTGAGVTLAGLPGIPAQFQPYKQWHRVNAKPIRGGSPAHPGTKNVFASKRAVKGKYPNGSIVVKEGIDPSGFVSLIATMRKMKGSDPAHGDWKFIEYTRSSRTAKFTEIARDGTCWGCHSIAKKTDWVYTTK